MNKRTLTSLAVLLVIALPTSAWAAEGGEFAETLEKGWLWAYLVAFGTGVLTSLTPCVYPMIPITVAVFGSKDEGTTRKKALGLAASYVCGMGLLFAVLGTAFAMAGAKSGTGSLLANPKVVIPLAILLFGLGLSLFGLFEVRLPMALQNRLNQVGGKGYGGAFGMGLVGGLIAAPCTGPFLAGMLAWVATTRDPVVGATLLFTYALGVGVLFFVLAVTSLSVPRSGAWMDGVKAFGGLGLFIVAIHFLRPVVPAIKETSRAMAQALGGPSYLLFLGIALAIAGLGLGALHKSFHGPLREKLRKGLGVALVTMGVTIAVSGLVTPDNTLHWRHDESVAFSDAKAANKGVMIDFGADWCAPCALVEKALGDDAVFAELGPNFVPLKFDVSKDTDADRALQKRFGASALPTVIFLDSAGRELVRYNNKSPDAESMLKTIKEAKGALRGSKSP